MANYINIYDMYRKCYDCSFTSNKHLLGSSQVGNEIKTYKKYF